MIPLLRRLLDRLPGRWPANNGETGRPWSRPGHFYSPLPDLADIRRREQAIFGELPEQFPGIDLNVAGQLDLLHKFRAHYRELPFKPQPQDGLRYYYHNAFYPYSDGITLFCMIRYLRPRRIIEVGSGFSSAVMLDTNELYFQKDIACTFIDPEPERLHGLLRPGDRERIEILAQPVQEIPVAKFAELMADDILFIDSSHVAKVGSDVNYLFFHVFPALKPGVMIHVHDIGYPFEYPKEYIYEGRAWNEIYLLRAFLQYNNAFRVEFFDSYLQHFYPQFFWDDMPLSMKATGGSLWLRKLT